ncbi:MAG: hypothetical protein QOH47_804 [Sphingomonadales bacterium]|nr:hypothetical protein [Sphingomonadales bacterium]
MPDPDWRTGHCAELAARAVYQACGRDVWADLGGCPRSWREAAALYRQLGVRTLREAVTAILGPPVDRKRAVRGDIVMFRGALGICRGEVAECLGAVVRMREVDLAWKAGGRS